MNNISVLQLSIPKILYSETHGFIKICTFTYEIRYFVSSVYKLCSRWFAVISLSFPLFLLCSFTNFVIPYSSSSSPSSQ